MKADHLQEHPPIGLCPVAKVSTFANLSILATMIPVARAPKISVAAVSVALSAAFSALPAEANVSKALTQQFCVGCHNNSTRTAGMSLQGLDPSAPHVEPAIWEKVLRRVSSGEMPPADAPAPDPSARAAFVEALEGALDAASAAAPNPGRPPAHRLNRAEYSNAVRDLLHLDLDIAAMLPVDDSGYGFDNIADVLTLSPALLDRYMFAARRISRLAVGSGPAKREKDIFVRNRESGFREAGHAPTSRQDLPIGAADGAAIRYYFPFSGSYAISVALDQGDSRTAYEQHDLRARVEAGMRTLAVSLLGEFSRPEASRPGNEVVAERPHPPIDIRLDGRRLELTHLPDTSKPYKIRWISIEGPFEPEGPGNTPSRRKIFSCRPAGPAEQRPCAERILSSLARQAYRRPIESGDLSALMSMYDIGSERDGFEGGIEQAIRALLVAPSFLFRIEQDPAGAGPDSVHAISDIELASRLSFFLWSSLPDDALLKAAEQGQLSHPGEIERQVRRMLRDRRATALVGNFAGQWLELRKVARAKPDEVLFPTFDADLRFAMRRETELFFWDILSNNRSVLELLDSDRTFLNDRLAEHYGLPGVHGPQFREVRLEDPRRGGLLGHGSILTVTSYPNRTSVVIRGKWVLDNLFGMPPPPPPPDIPELEEAAQDGKERTLRELMVAHSRSPTCASCHVRMDPIGFALENYDAIGRWRKMDGDAEIDPSGSLPGGVAFDGPEELKHVFSTVFRDAFVKTVAEKLLTYAIGRGLEYYDRAAVRKIARDAKQSGFRLDDMVVSVTKSMPFQMRRTQE